MSGITIPIPENSPGGLDSEVVPVAALVPGLKGLLIATVFSSFLVPTAVVLFVFSTPALRRRPSFVLNVCAIAFGLAQGTLTAYVVVSSCYKPASACFGAGEPSLTDFSSRQITEMVLRPPHPALVSVLTAVYIVGPICVQTILFLRVLAVHPPRQFALPVRLAIYGPTIVMKVTRAANAAYLLYTAQSNDGAPRTILSEYAAIWSSPFAKSELFLQLVDDVYVCALIRRALSSLTS